MNVLVATRNFDKFEIVRRMVEAVIPDAHLVSLSEAGIEGDVVEVGTIAERAAQKARYFMERLGWSSRADEFNAVLAVDDGLAIGDGNATPNSKELTDRILASEWAVGTPIFVVRGFALLLVGEVARVEMTTIPFWFLGNPNGVSRESGRYPLSRVLAPAGKQVPVNSLSSAEEDDFNIRHSRDALTRLFL